MKFVWNLSYLLFYHFTVQHLNTYWHFKYSGDLKSHLLKSGNIWNPDFWKLGFKRVWFSKIWVQDMVPTISNPDDFVRISNSFWQNSSHLSRFQRVWLLDFRSHSKSGAFSNQPLFDHLKSKHVRISDTH